MSVGGDGAILQIRDVRLAIRGSQILNGVTFDVSEASTVGVIGPNGSGKTTLFNCVCGFLRPQAGSIRLRGEELTPLSAASRARLGLGRVFQNSGVFRELTVLENMLAAMEGRDFVLAALLPWRSTSGERRARALQHLARVGLEGRAGERAGSLSGGQLRLLEIVRMLAFGAEVFLLDEPTAGVAPKMKEDVGRLIVELQNLGKTVLIIEHDIAFVQKFCSRIVVLDQGKVVLDDSPALVRESPLLREIYFGA